LSAGMQGSSAAKDKMPGSKTYPNAAAEGNGEIGICGLVGLVVQAAVAESLTHNAWLQHNMGAYHTDNHAGAVATNTGVLLNSQ